MEREVTETETMKIKEKRRRKLQTERKTQPGALFLQAIGEAMNCLNHSQSICEATRSMPFGFAAA